MEISNVFVHANGFQSFTRLNKFGFSLFKSFFVFKFKCMLQVNVSYLMLGMQIGHSEGLIELISV